MDDRRDKWAALAIAAGLLAAFAFLPERTAIVVVAVAVSVFVVVGVSRGEG